MMENNAGGRLIGRILLCLTLIACTYIVMSSLKQIKFGLGTIYVKGCAEKEIRSDFVTWSGTVGANADTEVNAYEQLEKNVEILKQYIQAQGLKLEEFEFLPITLSVTYERNVKGYSTNKIESISLSQEFSIASSDIPLITKLSQSVTSLFKEGITVISHSPKYFYSKLDELKINMLGAAAKDARQRAEELVNKSGASVGTLRSAHQGVFQITPVYSNSVSDYGEFDTSSIDKRIKAVVTMEFSIE